MATASHAVNYSKSPAEKHTQGISYTVTQRKAILMSVTYTYSVRDVIIMVAAREICML